MLREYSTGERERKGLPPVGEGRTLESGMIWNNADRIQKHPWLAAYGAILASTHILTVIFWLGSADYLRIVESFPRICWPYFTSCNDYSFSIWLGLPFLAIYFVLGILGTLWFLSGTVRGVRVGWVLLLAMTVLKWLALSQDYRLMGNYNYMQILIIAAFLFIPDKQRAISWLLVLFYFFAGLLKLNGDWVSGTQIADSSGLPAWALIPASLYVIVLELVLSWGLLSRRKWVFFPALLQFVAFHLFSWRIVGFFYPCIMLSLDSFFVFGFFTQNSTTPKEAREPIHPLTWAAVAAFVAIQLIPHLYPGDTALTSEGRIFSLSMFDARSDCGSLILRKSGNQWIEEPLTIPFVQPRIQCDPAVFYSYVKSLCRSNEHDGVADQIHFMLRSKRTTDLDFQTIVDEENFCDPRIQLSAWKPNPWIRRGQEPVSRGLATREPEYLLFRFSPYAAPKTLTVSTLSFNDSGAVSGTSDGWLHFLDSSGRTRWTYFLGSALAEKPVMDGTSVYVSDSSGKLRSIRKTDGKLQWLLEPLPGTRLEITGISTDGQTLWVSKTGGSAQEIWTVRSQDGTVDLKPDPKQLPSATSLRSR